MAAKPERSRIAPVRRSARDESSENLKKLLAGIEPKVAAEALARAETLGKLPAPHQVALRCALLAASESYKQGEIVRLELAKVRDHLQRTEKDLFAETQAFHRQSARSEAQVVSLRDDLTAATVANQEREARLRIHKIYGWLAVGTAMSVLLLCVFFLNRRDMPPVVNAEVSEVILPPVQVEIARPVTAPVVKKAFDTLDDTIARIPLLEVDNVLSAANKWLIMSGIPPCTIQLAEGQTSLLIGGKGKGARPLTAALMRCAQAVQHVTQ